MFSCYKVRIFSQTDLLFLEIYPLKVFSKIVCIRRTARRGVPSCHLFDSYALLIQGSNFQGHKLTCSQDIPTQIFFENRLYDIKIASLQLIETVNLHISKLKNVVSNYVIHKNIIFQSIFSNKFK